MKPFLFLITLLLFAGFWHPNLLYSSSKAPINIEADRMISLEEENSVLFSGAVDATQAEVRILSDEMTVVYTQTEGGKKEVSRIKCVGNVKISKGEWVGTSDQAEFFSKERKVLLSGNANAWQGKNRVTGDTIVYYLDEGRSEVIGARTSTTITPEGDKDKPSRVKATIIPQ